MTSILHSSIFHKVGQGLFHSSKFEIDQIQNSRIDYIIDCGSEDSKSFDNELKEYTDNIKFSQKKEF